MKNFLTIFRNFILLVCEGDNHPAPTPTRFCRGESPCTIINFIAMARKTTSVAAASKRRATSVAASSSSAAVRSPKLDWDFENTLNLSEMAEAIDADMSDIAAGYNTNGDGEDFPVLRVKSNKKSLKLPKESRGYVTFAPSMKMREQMEENGEEWSKDYIYAHARHFGFIPHPNDGYKGIGKLCLLTGRYEAIDLSDLLDEDDED